MPVVRGFDGAWVVPGRFAGEFEAILRAHYRRRQAEGFRFPNALWNELDAAKEAGELDRARRHPPDADPDAAPDKNPDADPDEKRRPGTLEDVGREGDIVRGLRRASAIAGCSAQSLHERCQRGSLPFERDGRVYLFRLENLTRSDEA